MRLFLAINLDPAVRRAIADATGPMRAAAPSLTWVDDARLHVTLKFLGEQPERALDPLRSAMDDVARRHRALPMRLGEIGAFPNFRRARVVWMGIEREPRLELLHHDVELACEGLGFELDGKPFRPHLTLARVTDRAIRDEVRGVSRASKRVAFEEETDVKSIDVMQSLSETGGSRYERVHAAPLGGGR